MPYKNKEDRLACQRRYYERNKAKVIKTTGAQRRKYRVEWAEFKKTLKCSKCGFAHPAAMDFHHIDPAEKESGIDRLLRNGAMAKIREEMKKCIVLCANCHRVHHYEEREKILAQTQKSSKIA